MPTDETTGCVSAVVVWVLAPGGSVRLHGAHSLRGGNGDGRRESGERSHGADLRRGEGVIQTVGRLRPAVNRRRAGNRGNAVEPPVPERLAAEVWAAVWAVNRQNRGASGRQSDVVSGHVG